VDLPGSSATSVDWLSVRQGTVTFALNGGTLDLATTSTTSLKIAEFGGTPSVSISGGTLLTRSTSIAVGSLNTASTSRGTLSLSNGTWINSGSLFVAGSDATAGGTRRSP
jgi:hypothetical protein